MPYRRLPNTDLARIRALRSAQDMEEILSSSELGFSFTLLRKLHDFLPHFELAISNHHQAIAEQSVKSKAYNERQRKARLYVSHFIQVLNFTIAREELKPEVREFYGLKINSQSIPNLVKDAKLIEWGYKLIEGERLRIAAGGNPIYSPSIALVRVHCDQFRDAYNHQKRLQSNTQRFSEQVAERRHEADQLILDIWNDVETYYKDKSEEERREICSRYGIVYVWRKSELEKQKQEKSAENSTLNLPFSSAK
ncbi:hypothetical protein [Ancylomarina sp. 16SWW S1-10-2]|uniref:hypothetical protein n=1 Tax=Ancylomarina sp. 16SWW S1-10-2 TaxID=2499681 RepID=UPI0012ADC577|nr:hypothetical protein [Ancylomarina sp. 16SWW S1-10-2]MRT92176.1 hypothetical protein [Ancylomarina sp. 16SWW S1-10-2]